VFGRLLEREIAATRTCSRFRAIELLRREDPLDLIAAAQRRAGTCCSTPGVRAASGST